MEAPNYGRDGGCRFQGAAFAYQALTLLEISVLGGVSIDGQLVINNEGAWVGPRTRGCRARR